MECFWHGCVDHPSSIPDWGQLQQYVCYAIIYLGFQEKVMRHLNFHGDRRKEKKRSRQINAPARNPNEVSEHSPNSKNMKRWKMTTIPKDIHMENTIPGLKYCFAFPKTICSCVENFKTGIITSANCHNYLGNMIFCVCNKVLNDPI